MADGEFATNDTERLIAIAVHEKNDKIALDKANALIKDGKVEVRLESRGLVVSLQQAAFFPSGGDDVAARRGCVTTALTLSKFPVRCRRVHPHPRLTRSLGP